jgi:DNA-binding Xre family transcriptional regulator
MKDFSNKLKRILSEQKITQGELCEKIGMTPQGLKKAIDKEKLHVTTVEDICRILDVDVSYFIEVQTKPTGMWQRLLDEANSEAQRWKMRAFELEEKFGVGNFHRLSKYVNSFFCLQH